MYLNHLFTERVLLVAGAYSQPFRPTMTLPAQACGFHRKQLAPHLRPDAGFKLGFQIGLNRGMLPTVGRIRVSSWTHKRHVGQIWVSSWAHQGMLAGSGFQVRVARAALAGPNFKLGSTAECWADPGFKLGSPGPRWLEGAGWLRGWGFFEATTGSRESGFFEATTGCRLVTRMGLLGMEKDTRTCQDGSTVTTFPGEVNCKLDLWRFLDIRGPCCGCPFNGCFLSKKEKRMTSLSRSQVCAAALRVANRTWRVEVFQN